MEIYHSPRLEIRKITVGPYSNNVYVLICKATRKSLIIDASFEVPRIVEAAAGSTVQAILQTHCHMDHVAGLDELKATTQAPVGIHPRDEEQFHLRGDFQLEDGATVRFGECALQVMHTPGHSKGGLCFLHEPHCFCGDTLFPGGPGKTWSARDFESLLRSITKRLYLLPDHTILYPGHGLNTTIGDSKAEYAIYAAKKRSAPVYGDVLWSQS